MSIQSAQRVSPTVPSQARPTPVWWVSGWAMAVRARQGGWGAGAWAAVASEGASGGAEGSVVASAGAMGRSLRSGDVGVHHDPGPGRVSGCGRVRVVAAVLLRAQGV